MFPKAVVLKLIKYYETELEGRVYNNLVIETVAHKKSLPSKNITIHDHFVVENPSDKLIKDSDGILVFVTVRGKKYLLSEFTYNYYYWMKPQGYSTAVVMFIERDIFGNCMVAMELVKKFELFEITCGSNIRSDIEFFLYNNRKIFKLAENSILEIKQIGEFSRYFNRNLINSSVIINTAVYVVIHEVINVSNESTEEYKYFRLDINAMKRYYMLGHIGCITSKIIMDWHGVEYDSTIDNIRVLKDLVKFNIIKG
jgi:hypothetical protein